MMKHMSLKYIAEACGGELYAKPGCEHMEISCAVLDSRQIEAGGLFLAMAGERVDGHRFIPDVFAKGALCVLTEKTPEELEREEGISPEIWNSYILVENTPKALQDIAEYYRRQLSIPVIGITGSVGKTSTKEMIAGVLSAKFNVLKTMGNFNNELGLPLTLLRIRQEHEAAVLEMGISDFGEMHRLSRMAKPDICVLTNIGQSHLNNLKDREGVLRAKTEIFDFMAEGGYTCVNGDDDMLDTLDVVKGRGVLRFGLGEHNDVYAADIENRGLFGSRATIRLRDFLQSEEAETHSVPKISEPGKEPGKEKEYSVEVVQPGQHMVRNATAAVLVAKLLGLSQKEIQAGFGKVESVSGRSNILRTKEWTLIDDCYNANPVSMKAALDLLKTATTRKVAILGDMLNLGEDSDRMHQEIGSYAVENNVDVLLCGGENAGYIYRAAKEAKTAGNSPIEICFFATLEELLEALPGLLAPEDTILVKASHGMNFAEIVKWVSSKS